LRQADYRSTRLDTYGGFLRRGNATFFIGVEAEQVDDVVRIVEESCRARTAPAPASRTGSVVPPAAATIFVLDVARFERL
jgi:uncharacterized protein YaaQ